MKNNIVSVIIPCYNVSSFLVEGLESIINQTYEDLEIVCLNDCSTDNTLEILMNFANKDSRIKVYSNEENKGLIYTLNRLIQLSSHDILVRMDPDDIAEKDRIETLVNKLHTTNSDLVSSNYSLIDSDGDFLKKKGFDLLTSPLGIRYTAIFNSPFPHPQTIYRKQIFLDHKYDEKFKAAEDYKLWCSLLLEDHFKGIIIDKKLYRYRINENGMSLSNASLQAENHIKIAKNYLSSILDIDGNGMEFWNIAKKNYNFKTAYDLELQLKNVLTIRNEFIKKFSPSDIELEEINKYTFQYLIYLYLNIFEMAKKGIVNKYIALKVICMSFFNTITLYNLKNIKWILKNI